MAQALAVNIGTSIASVNLVGDAEASPAPQVVTETDGGDDAAVTSQQSEQVISLCNALQESVSRLNHLHDEIFNGHREQIAKLSVEIAERILLKEIEAGQYNIENTIQTALKTAPSQDGLVVRLNPGDLQQYQQILESKEVNPLSDVKLAADPNIGPAECVIETDKGTIECLIKGHIKQIADALKNSG